MVEKPCDGNPVEEGRELKDAGETAPARSLTVSSNADGTVSVVLDRRIAESKTVDKLVGPCQDKE